MVLENGRLLASALHATLRPSDRALIPPAVAGTSRASEGVRLRWPRTELIRALGRQVPLRTSSMARAAALCIVGVTCE